MRVVVVVLVIAGCGSSGATPAPAIAAEWPTPSGDLAGTRYSPLAQIDTTNVGELHVVATIATGATRGHEGGPLVVGSRLYAVTPFPDNLVAVDLDTTEVAWMFRPRPALDVPCCDLADRGASAANGKIVYNLLDGHTVAVDAASGRELWRVTIGDAPGMAPIVADRLVLAGTTGTRGKLVALDLETGAEVWRAYSTGSDRDVRIGRGFAAFYAKDRGRELGVASWPTNLWRDGGGSVAGPLSYDAETHTVFYGTGNAGIWNPDMRPGDNKWSCAIVARDARTGMARWAYQIAAHDAWNDDETAENIVVDLRWGGVLRKLLVHPGRNGFLFVLDRGTGEVLSAKPFARTTGATGYDLASGKPIGTTDRACASGPPLGASALSPRTGMLYLPARTTCAEPAVTAIADTPIVGAAAPPDGSELVAWDVARATRAWSSPLALGTGGVLATAGDVVFVGTTDGTLVALDARTGAIRWKQKLGTASVADPITYLGPDGKQYVAVYANHEEPDDALYILSR